MTRLSLLFALSISACATSASSTQPTAAPKVANGEYAPTVEVCEWETPVGTNVRTRVCHREEDLSDERRAAKDFIGLPKAHPGRIEQ